HPRLLELIRAHRSTLIFVNSRRLAERLAGALNELAGETLVRSHHGSIARAQRMEVEDLLKAGGLRALVATSSLELGIDMGAIDLVVQIEAPPSVASGLQRIGRGGHRADAVSEGVIFPKFRGDLVAGVITRREGAKRVAIANGGTIPDRGLYGVFLAGAGPGAARVGELDEEMVFESRVGETFVLGASSWRIEEITHDRVLVSPAPGEPGKMPFWKGDRAGRPLELGLAIGRL